MQRLWILLFGSSFIILLSFSLANFGTRQVLVVHAPQKTLGTSPAAAASSVFLLAETDKPTTVASENTPQDAVQDSSTTHTETPSAEANTASAQEEKTTLTQIDNPYPFPPLSVEELNEKARAALVNILCESDGGPVRSTSGSGILIDRRGVILTNAHVAQYFLLENSSSHSVSCSIRTGSPAHEAWRAQLLFFPSQWIKEHANEVLETRPLGTGEHDYALLYITGALIGTLPAAFPYVAVDAREAIARTGDEVLAAAYPAEFIRGISARTSLYPASTIAKIQQMLTFSEDVVDAISLGGTAVAQSGSSGGAVLNLWGNLVGLVVTTSEGETTAMRDLRAITMAHLERSLRAHTGSGLEAMLSDDVSSKALKFTEEQALELVRVLVSAIEEDAAN